MNFEPNYDRRAVLAVDLLGSAILLAVVWGAFTMLFGDPKGLTTRESTARVEMSASFDIYDSVMTDDEDWQMLASR